MEEKKGNPHFFNTPIGYGATRHNEWNSFTFFSKILTKKILSSKERPLF